MQKITTTTQGQYTHASESHCNYRQRRGVSVKFVDFTFLLPSSITVPGVDTFVNVPHFYFDFSTKIFCLL